MRDHSGLVIKKSFAAYMFYHPHGLPATIYFWLLEHYITAQVIFISGFLMEGCFIIGFFTKRFDRYLFVLSLLLPFGFLFFSDAFSGFIEIILFNPVIVGERGTYKETVVICIT